MSYQIEWADNIDAAIWNSTGVVQQVINDDGTNRTIRAVLLQGASGHRFVRLKLTH